MLKCKSSLVILLAWVSAPSVRCSFFGCFLTQEQKETRLKEQVNEVFQQVGLAINLDDDNNKVALEEGKRAFGCVTAIGGFDHRSKMPQLPFFQDVVMTLLYEMFYQQYASVERINQLCAVADRRRKLHTTEMRRSSPKGAGSGTGLRRHRRLGEPATVNYPHTRGESYKGWAEDFLMEDYMIGSDMSQHTNVDQVTDLVLRPLIQQQQDVIADGLAVTEATVAIVCNVLGTIEIGFDPGDACRIVESSIYLTIVINDAATRALKIEQEAINIHDRYIESAEIEAIHENVVALVSELT